MRITSYTFRAFLPDQAGPVSFLIKTLFKKYDTTEGATTPCTPVSVRQYMSYQ